LTVDKTKTERGTAYWLGETYLIYLFNSAFILSYSSCVISSKSNFSNAEMEKQIKRNQKVIESVKKKIADRLEKN